MLPSACTCQALSLELTVTHNLHQHTLLLMEKSFVIFLHCVVLLLVQCHMFTTPALNITSDQSALLSLKAHITYDPHTVLTKNWSTSTSICSWFGVTCGSRHHRITALNLSYMGLVGTIPPQMGNLSFLVSLSIENNSFYGSLPDELVRLRRLQFLSLGFNNFTGEIPPWMGQLSKLQNLYLFYNNFVGNIPQSLSNISSLQEIDLGCNQLFGSIPSPILNMPSLRVIILPSNKLSGELPVDVFNHLPDLQCLDLSYNQFHGKLPSNLFKCKGLQALWLRSNNFTGGIPFEIGNLTLLLQLDISHNKLEGNLPSTIFKCRQLQILYLQYNHFTGRVPLDIGNLTILTQLSLLDNYFEGAIPTEIGNLQKLKFFGAAGNNFTGPIPAEIFNISTMQEITMAFNNFSGHLPSNIGLFLLNLQYLLLEGNKLSGTIPSSISNASQLTILDLGQNSFFGLIPKALGNLRLLQALVLEDNNLTTEPSPTKCSFLFNFFLNFLYLTNLELSNNPLNIILPTSIGNLSTSLQVLYMVRCNIKGTIPKDIGNLTTLMDLKLGMNELTGFIPSTIERLYDLQGLYIQKNALEGPIPSNLCHLKRLDSLYLSGNELSGSIPSCINNLTSLRHLFLDSNRITSVIPRSFWSLTYILEVYLSSNALNGTLPLEIKNLKVLIKLNLSRNHLSGDIPQVIDNCKDMKYLSLANNQFEGLIPDSIGKLVSLEFLDLSNNNLFGEIPKSLEALIYLKYLNVSFNRLRGKIPTGGPFVHFPAISFISNDGLCGASKLQVLPCKVVSQSNKTIATQTLKYLLPTIGLAVVVVILVSRWKRHKNRNTKFEVEKGLPHLPIWRRISYKELIQATDGFSANNFLGEGSFGLVYQGKLLDGKNVAIKVLNLEVEGALQVFSAECEILSNIRHRNLVKIISICSNMNFKALILEYMPNGSLESWLHSQNYYLNIFQRLNIMVDIASALEYLHYGYSMHVVHCDLKPSNVLLDKDMVAHVADFGIAKLLGDVNIMMQTMTLATIGYMAPEYGSGGIISTKGDVYSFGILLMETFTRKKPTDVMFTVEMSLKHWVEESLTISVTKVVDSNLLRAERDHASMEDFMSSIMELALSCCAELPNQRIDAKTISVTLKRIKSKFLQRVGAI